MNRIDQRIRIEADGSVTAFSGKMEFGQGLHSAYQRMIAHELSIDASQVAVILGDTDVAPWDMGTFGSMSVEVDGLELRRAAACARAALLARASVQMNTETTNLEIENGVVRRIDDGRTVGFGALVGDVPIAGDIADNVSFLAGAPLAHTVTSGGARDIVLGRTEFVGDVHIAGLLAGVVLHPALYGAHLSSIDRDAAMRMPGVVAVVHDGDFVGIVADRRRHALAARAALKPVWNARDPAPNDVTEAILRRDAGVDEALAHGALRRSATYFAPHIAAAPLGPSVGVADVGPTDATVYATTQAPFRLRDQVARIAGLSVERVHVKPRAMSGGFGRHGAHDAAIEAARLSHAVGRPVRVQWGRDDELHAAPHRAEMTAALEASLDATGRIVAWRADIMTNPYTYDADGASAHPASAPSGASPAWSPAQAMAMMAGRNGVPSYEIGQAAIRLHVAPARIRTGALRSLGATPNVFAIESFIDELAHAAGQDPLAFRFAHVADVRLRRVLEAVRDRSGWSNRARGGGFGVACVVYRHTYVATIVEVSVAPTRTVTLERVWCAVDAGHIVDEDGARNQVEGAVQMAASWALLEQLPHREGEITASAWADYPIATFRDAPQAIDVSFVGDDTVESAGLGEPPAVPIPAAVANAVFDACGERVRALPIRLGAAGPGPGCAATASALPAG